MQKTPGYFSTINYWISCITARGKWERQGVDALDPQGWYVMIANHQSWLDILVLGNFFHREIPPLKFFMKKELLWQLPIIGLACYALGYPFMSRHSHAQIRKNPKLKGQDLASTQKACQRLRQYPTTLINFLEGTRFTAEKKIRQNSPYQYLLKPRVGGLALVLKELEGVCAGLLNVTIGYSGKTPSIWEFACGRFEKIVVRYHVMPITADMLGDYHKDREFRAAFQKMLNACWEKNDAWLDALA